MTIREDFSLSEIDAKKDSCSCNVCHAANYFDGTDAEVTDRMFELRVGRNITTFCPKCIKELSCMLAELNMPPKFPEHSVAFIIKNDDGTVKIGRKSPGNKEHMMFSKLDPGSSVSVKITPRIEYVAEKTDDDKTGCKSAESVKEGKDAENV